MWHVPWAPGVQMAALLVSILTTAGTIIVWRRNVHWYGGAVSALQADLALLFSTVLPFATTWLGVFHSAAFRQVVEAPRDARAGIIKIKRSSQPVSQQYPRTFKV
ncbi:hypothetical protein DIPPA_00609 [Diplonema papillatum]|nr:hypothetical protein DIPPA_00609 [Diplonema papillatum]